MTNANRSLSSVNDRLFPVELTEKADWKSMSEYMLHSNFGKPQQGSSAGILVHRQNFVLCPMRFSCLAQGDKEKSLRENRRVIIFAVAGYHAVICDGFITFMALLNGDQLKTLL